MTKIPTKEEMDSQVALTSGEERVFGHQLGEIMCERSQRHLNQRNTLHAIATELEAENERLRESHSQEVKEFNDGHSCALSGGSIDDEPIEGIPEDQWQTGFMAGSFTELQARLKRIEEAIRTELLCCDVVTECPDTAIDGAWGLRASLINILEQEDTDGQD